MLPNIHENVIKFETNYIHKEYCNKFKKSFTFKINNKYHKENIIPNKINFNRYSTEFNQIYSIHSKNSIFYYVYAKITTKSIKLNCEQLKVLNQLIIIIIIITIIIIKDIVMISENLNIVKIPIIDTDSMNLNGDKTDRNYPTNLLNENYQNATSSSSISSLDEFNISWTPSISQVIFAPTTPSLIPFLSNGDPPLATSAILQTNLSSGNTTGSDEINSFYFYETEQFAVLWILFSVIVLGNSAVLVTMLRNKRKSRMNFFIKQLALADLSVGLLNVLTDIIWRITISWRAGNVACKAIRFSQVCVTYASTYVLVALSIDRYDAITHPLNFSKSYKRARRLVAGAWIISIIFSSPMLLLYEEKLIQGQTQCWIDLGEAWRWQVYMTLVSTTLFAVPAIIISACYAIIVRTIWVKGSIFVPVDRGNYATAASRRASSRGLIPRAKVKTVKMTFVIVIVFILCWSPYIVFDLLQVFGHIPRTQTNIAIATFIQSLAPLNSAANPIIYWLFSPEVFRSLSQIPPFRWFICCCKSQVRHSAPNRCNTVGQRLHNSCDSMRTLTTSLTVSRRSNRPPRVIIVERPQTVVVISEWK